MNDNNNYVDEERAFPWARLFLGLTSVILIIVILLLFVKFCEKKSLSDDLLKAGKKYYEDFPTYLPTITGQCLTVSLAELENNHYISSKKYDGCDKTATYVNVCYLESKNYHYSAILSCESETSNYDLWKDGKESDLTDKSDVRFKFLAQELTLGTKYYYPSDKTQTTDVNEYYKDVPSNDYIQKEDEQVGYKWYTNKTQKSYYKDYSSTQPNGYPNKGESKVVTNYSLSEPNKASYRTIEAATLYRYQTVARQFKWECKSATKPGYVTSNVVCALRTDGYTQLQNAYYTCDGTNKVDDPKKICADYTSWSTDVCKTSALNGINCESKAGYVYKDTMWKWYKNDTVRSYYPSGTSKVEDEKTYYIHEPVSGAIKDEATKATVYKFYKLDQNTTGSHEQWNNITDGYVTESELMEALVKKGYTVYSLNDIAKLEKIRYEYQLQYRNLEK